MARATDLIKMTEGTMEDGIWVVLLGSGGELDREFVKNKSEIKDVVSRWGSILDVGDMIKIEAGSSENSGSGE
jgi:hypothetical protein